jgi:hypothetical protein
LSAPLSADTEKPRNPGIANMRSGSVEWLFGFRVVRDCDGREAIAYCVASATASLNPSLISSAISASDERI